MIGTLNDLFLRELGSFYAAEKKLREALPEMADAAESHDLALAFHEQYRQCQDSIEQIERVFGLALLTPTEFPAGVMQSMVGEIWSLFGSGCNHTCRDVALVSAAQKVKHFEISALTSLRAYAEALKSKEASRIFQRLLIQVETSDLMLCRLSMDVLKGAPISGGRMSVPSNQEWTVELQPATFLA